MYKKKYSFAKGVKKISENFLEIALAFITALAPQLGALALNIITNTPPEQLHVPAAWVTGWYVFIRILNNWRKNRTEEF